MVTNTATVNVTTFKRDWHANLMIVQICDRHTLTKDQVVRLRVLWQLPPRIDRAARARPTRYVDPTPEELADRTRAVRETWNADTEHRRRVSKSADYTVPEIPSPFGLEEEIG
jgi:hypothetical protein